MLSPSCLLTINGKSKKKGIKIAFGVPQDKSRGVWCTGERAKPKGKGILQNEKVSIGYDIIDKGME